MKKKFLLVFRLRIVSTDETLSTFCWLKLNFAVERKNNKLKTAHKFGSKFNNALQSL